MAIITYRLITNGEPISDGMASRDLRSMARSGLLTPDGTADTGRDCRWRTATSAGVAATLSTSFWTSVTRFAVCGTHEMTLIDMPTRTQMLTHICSSVPSGRFASILPATLAGSDECNRRIFALRESEMSNTIRH